MAVTFKRATKTDARLRLALSGPAGAGKTYTALVLATALADGKPIALIDTEHGSASKYADQFTFDTLPLTNFHPGLYIEAIRAAEEDYAVLIVDSLSHAWSGTGGLLEEKDRIAATKHKGNSFMAWNEAGKLQNDLVNTILASNLHIIATVRSKMDYVLEKDERTGKTHPRKVGLAPVQRDDLPYEFDVFCTMEADNTLIVDKSRCPGLAGAVIAKPDAKMARLLSEWLAGEKLQPPPAASAADRQVNGDLDHEISQLVPAVANATDQEPDVVISWLKDHFGLKPAQRIKGDATDKQKREMISALKERLPEPAGVAS